jgi:hypothetical protein
MGVRTGLDNMEKLKFLTLLGLEPLPLDRPACSQSLYPLLCLSYPLYVSYIKCHLFFPFVHITTINLQQSKQVMQLCKSNL